MSALAPWAKGVEFSQVCYLWFQLGAAHLRQVLTASAWSILNWLAQASCPQRNLRSSPCGWPTVNARRERYRTRAQALIKEGECQHPVLEVRR
jgi:hypothetical protein